MSFVLAAPEAFTSVASDLANLGSTVDAAHAAAAARTTNLLTAAEDEVSTAIAALFGAHGQAFQDLGVQAAAFQKRFLQALSAAAGSYSLTEAANASPLQAAEQSLLTAVNPPAEALLGRPLIGNGANGVVAARWPKPTAAPAGSWSATAAPARRTPPARAGPAGPAG